MITVNIYDTMSVCFICDASLEDGTLVSTVKSRGIASFIEASRKRSDGKAVFLKKKTSVNVHEKCRKVYVNDRMVAAFVNSAKKERSTTFTTTRSLIPEFNFRTHCFLCGKRITEEFIAAQSREPPSQRNTVYSVQVDNLRDTVLKVAIARNDDYGQSIIQRIEPVADLIAAYAQYHSKCYKDLYGRPKVQEHKRRGPHAVDIDKAMQCIYDYIENSDDECQFSMEQLIEQIKGNYQPEVKTVKARLIEKYGDDILFASIKKKKTVVCFKNTGEKILTNSWYQKTCMSEREERLRVVEAAAKIICEDIRTQVYNTTDYPPPDRFLEESQAAVPETLKSFLDTLIVNRKRGNIKKWTNKCNALAHSIITSVRPNSFLSNIQVGLAAFIYKKCGSRKLLDVLHSMGFCSSYSETVRFEISSAMKPEVKINRGGFCQFVYDNADFNTQTIDGYHTFHVMGGIYTVAPATAVPADESIPRLTDIPKTKVVGNFGAVSLKHFESAERGEGLKQVKIQDLSNRFSLSENVFPCTSDILWLYSKFKGFPAVPGWNLFMEQVTSDLVFEKTFAAYLPFINAPPTDYDTIFTALLEAADKCKANGQKICMVTFDQPLYLKARFIISNCTDSRLHNVVPRLGGFHLLMSFLGSIGHIMDGSGLKDLFNTIYALNSIEKIMTGHAYYRAVRAHLLAQVALMKIVMNMIKFSSEMETKLNDILHNFDKSVILSSDHDECREFKERVNHQLQQLKQRGSTAQLWVLYIQLVTLVKLFISSERMGNWDQHLETVWKMLPYFHASGHFAYAKCAHLYLQDMLNLKQIMSVEEYDKFSAHGFFTVRRSEKFWCGTWTDMTIEQFLMKNMKLHGGLTHGRGVGEGVLARWTLGMTSVQHVCEQIENYCGVTFNSSEQHVGLKDSRVKRDNKDEAKMYEWLLQHFPFPENPDLYSISTGVVADDRINCHKAWDIGCKSINRIACGDFGTVKFKRCDRVQPLAVMTSAIQVHNELIPINPTSLFQRMTVAKHSEEQLEKFLTYDLGPFSLTLFDNGLRKGTKSTLYKAFKPLTNKQLSNQIQYVIDGGFLLHRVLWTMNQTFSCIYDNYVEYVKSKYQSNAVIVFDGYPEGQDGGTKSAERIKRSRKLASVDILFDDTMMPTVSKERFLANIKNKNRFISMLITRFSSAGITCKQAKEDADTLIVNTALELSPTNETVIIVGEDIDLLVILIGLCKYANVFFLKPGKNKVSAAIFSPTDALSEAIIADNILFLHAMGGCDTTSALYNQGKLKFLHTLRKNSYLAHSIKVFKDSNATQNMVADAGERFLVSLYGYTGKTVPSLNHLRYVSYIKSAFKHKVNIASLPPSAAAARQHSLRVYHQVQQWLGVEKNPEEWGWKKLKTGLAPVTSLLPPAPDDLLKLVSCKCTINCQRSCGCRKAGLNCSTLCLNCENSCDNTAVILENQEDEEEMTNELELDFLVTNQMKEEEEIIQGIGIN